MFKNLGQMAGLMKDLPKLQEAMKQFQESLGKITTEADAGAGMVTVRVNGHQQVVRCEISEEAFSKGDRELLEDLIRSATNSALEKVQKQVLEERQKLMGSFLPEGMQLPDLPGMSS